jgi:superfamily II DNA or RNA helicase
MSLTTSSDDQHGPVETALMRLAGRCDGARTEDEQGFNKMHSGFGKSLAEQIESGGTLTDRQFHAAVKILRVYRNTQIADLWPAIEQAAIDRPSTFTRQPVADRAAPRPAASPQIRVECEDDRLVVVSPFSFRETVKALPGRQWDPARKVWKLPASIHTAEALARAARLADIPIAGDRQWDDLLDQARDAWRARQHKETAPEASLPDVPGKTRAWTHQARAFAFGRKLPAVGLGMDMGTGKSRTAIGFIEEHNAIRVLILCPVNPMRVWPSQFAQHALRDWHVELAHGSSKARAKRVPQLLDQASRDGRPVAYVINYESSWRDPIDAALLAQDWDVVICDESHRIKAPGGRASVFAHRVGKKATHRLALTGTPMAHTPLDVYAQCRFLDEGVFGTSYFRFSHRYGLYGGYEGREFEGMDPEHIDEFTEKFASLWFTCKAEDVLDLPELHEVSRTVPLEPAARRLYEQMSDDFIADFSEVDDEERAALIAANAAVRVLRLQQISCGSLPDPDTGEAVTVSTAKADLLRDVLADLPESEPVVVFARFSADLRAIRKVADDLGRRYNEISGNSKDALGDDAKLVSGCQVVGVQIQSGGVGIDLTAAHVAVFYSVGYSLSDYLQAQKRVHRPGQTRSTLYVHLLAERTIDAVVYRALQAHEDVVDAVMAAAKRGEIS